MINNFKTGVFIALFVTLFMLVISYLSGGVDVVGGYIMGSVFTGSWVYVLTEAKR